MTKRLRVLVVDDVPENVEVIGETLSRQYDIQCAFSGQEALQLIAEEQPDLILLDIMMPDMDGFEVLVNLKSDRATCDIPVIFVTAKHDEDSETAVLQAGALDFIHKPINPNVLRARVGLCLALKAREQKLVALNEALSREIAERNRSESQLRMAFSVINHTSEGVMVTDKQGLIISVNPAFSQITGYGASEVVGQNPRMLKSDHHDAEFFQKFWTALLNEGFWQGEILNRRKSGEVFPMWQSINRVDSHEGQPTCYVSVFHDISEQREAEERMRFLAFHDALTSLPNRTLFQDRLQQGMERARRGNTQLSVTFIDLDGFKEVNDRFGHEVGDRLLQEIATRIRSQIRRGVDTVARLGGDEFVILMEESTGVEFSEQLLGELSAEIARPMEIRGHTVQVSASMGTAFYPSDSVDAAQLVALADKAMYAAKMAGKARSLYFRPEMLEPAAPG